MCHGQGRVGIAARGPISQPETKPVSWNLFLDISGDGPGAIAASSCPGRGGGGDGHDANQTLETAPSSLQRSLREKRQLSACAECVGCNYFSGELTENRRKTEGPLADGIIFVLPSLHGEEEEGEQGQREKGFPYGKQTDAKMPEGNLSPKEKPFPRV